MQKIKSIQKGTGEDCIYYTTHITQYQKQQLEKGTIFEHIMDRIECNWVDKEQTFDNQNSGVMLTYTMKLSYQGWKDNKLVFEIFNPDLVTYETTEN